VDIKFHFFGGDLKERDNLKDLSVDGKIILEWISKLVGKAWAGFIWLRTRTSGGLL
jgi:hypothetical protein